MKFSTMNAYLFTCAVVCGVCNVSAMDHAMYFNGKGGVVVMQLKMSEERAECCAYSCIPSSPATCTGACCIPSRGVMKRSIEDVEPLLAKQEHEKKAAYEELREILKKWTAVFGKTEAVKIAKTAVQEVDSDTDSSSLGTGSIGSPHENNAGNPHPNFPKDQ